MIGSRAARHRAPVRHVDDGFTVAEVVVAIAVVVIVMTALAAFFVTTSNATDYQGQRQSASQLAQDGMDKATSLSVAGMLAGRTKSASDSQWAAGKVTGTAATFPGVAPFLTNLGEAYDTSGAATANLPVDGVARQLNGTTFTQNWFLGYCTVSSGVCTPGTDTTSTGSNATIVVAVTWRSNSCTTNTARLCSYVTASQLNAEGDPVFGAPQTGTTPTITNPGNQTSEVGQAVNLPITMTGGTAAFTWIKPTLPAGLNWVVTSAGVSIQGTPTAVTGTPVTVKLQVTDSLGKVATPVSFTWSVNAGPKLATIADVTDTTNTAENFNVSVSGGTGPYTWSAKYLPKGITLTGNNTTANLSGTPTQAAYNYVQITVTDKYGGTDTQTFTWTTNLYQTSSASPCTRPSPGVWDCAATTTVKGDAPFVWTSDNPVNTTFSLSTDTKTATYHVRFYAKGVYKTRITITQSVFGSTTSVLMTSTCN